MLQCARLAVVGPLLLAAAQAPAQQRTPPAPPPFHLVQRVDEMLVGVDSVAMAILDRDHVAGTYFLINARKPSPIAGYANYVVDCREPMRMATTSSAMPSGSLEPETPFLQPPRRNGGLDVNSLRYEPVHVLDGTRFVAEFACRVTNQFGRAAQIARQLYESGGPKDLARIYCDLRSDSGKQREGVEVRYSEEENVVAVNGQWLSSGFLSGDEIVFGTGAQWRVDRKEQTARLVRDDGTRLLTVACDTRPPAKAKTDRRP